MPETDETIYFDARMTPNRSMSDRAVLVFMGMAGAVSLLSSLYFIAEGALPIVGFFGLDLLALWLGFRWIRRHQAQETRVRVTRSHVDVHHRDGQGQEKRARLPTLFVRVEADGPAARGRGAGVRLMLSDRTYVVGAFLTPEERVSFAQALRGAIASARRG